MILLWLAGLLCLWALLFGVSLAVGNWLDTAPDDSFFIRNPFGRLLAAVGLTPCILTLLLIDAATVGGRYLLFVAKVNDAKQWAQHKVAFMQAWLEVKAWFATDLYAFVRYGKRPGEVL